MSVIIKRSEKSKAIPQECPYGCCTEVHGKNVPKIRRQIKRSERQQVRKMIQNECD